MKADAASGLNYTVEMVVIRKDGRREDHGVIGFHHRSRLRRLLYRLRPLVGPALSRRLFSL